MTLNHLWFSFLHEQIWQYLFYRKHRNETLKLECMLAQLPNSDNCASYWAMPGGQLIAGSLKILCISLLPHTHLKWLETHSNVCLLMFYSFQFQHFEQRAHIEEAARLWIFIYNNVLRQSTVSSYAKLLQFLFPLVSIWDCNNSLDHLRKITGHYSWRKSIIVLPLLSKYMFASACAPMHSCREILEGWARVVFFIILRGASDQV